MLSIFMSESKFYVYSRSGCGFCNKLTEFMKNKGIKYEKFDLGTDFSTEDFLNEFGRQSTFPQVVVENQKIGGMKDTVRFLMEHKMV
jgi:glutaredoxin